MNKKTIGAVAQELLQKTPDTLDPIALQREMQKDYEDNLISAVNRARRDSNIPSVFYVIVETKKERLLSNIIRNYFFYRASCPTPTYDQAVYRVDTNEDVIEFLWVIPSKDTCEMFLQSTKEVVPEEQGLLYFVQAFENGKLLHRAKQLNKEV